MKEYLVNSGEFEIIVRPEKKAYHIVEELGDPAAIVGKFVAGDEIPYDKSASYWFKYESDEGWEDLDGNAFSLGDNFSESELLDRFLLKKYNAGSLIAMRDSGGQKVKVYKKDRVDKLVAK